MSLRELEVLKGLFWGPGAPLTYFTDRGGGGGPRDFFGSGKILTKRDFLGSMKDVGVFFGCKKTQKQCRDFF